MAPSTAAKRARRIADSDSDDEHQHNGTSTSTAATAPTPKRARATTSAPTAPTDRSSVRRSAPATVTAPPPPATKRRVADRSTNGHGRNGRNANTDDDDGDDEDGDDREVVEPKPRAKRSRTSTPIAPVAAAKPTARRTASSSSSAASSSAPATTAATRSAKSKADPPKRTTRKAASASPTPGSSSSQAAATGNGEEPDGTPGNGGEDDDNDDDGEYKWWRATNAQALGSTTKWTASLQHNGVLFPPEYEPHGVQMLYDGRPVTLGAEAEEVATFYAGIVGTPHEENEVFRANFFADFTAILKATEPNCPITELTKCDFTPIVEHLAADREKKKALTKAEKDAIKKEKAEIEAKYGIATIDGRTEKIGNFRVEPPGLFRGRGAHPHAGKLKTRVTPEMITINIGANDPVPPAPEGHQWGNVVHNNEVTWLATWTENVNSQTKYVFLAATSSWKGMSDFKKFEKARELKKHVSKIRDDYTTMLKDREMVKRQLATALYFIDKFALRAGNEKGEDEADTVGCCSLRYEHVILHDGNTVEFDFLGKDSIRYHNVVKVDAQVHRNLRLFKKDHVEGDELFDRIDTSSLNKHLASLMPGLTAKVFRTYNASHTFQEELRKTPADGSTAEKMLAYNRANREVAVLCNHQRTVPKSFQQSMERMRDKVRALKYMRREIKKQVLEIDPKRKRSDPTLSAPESDLDEDWITTYLAEERERDAEKDIRKLEKINEDRVAAGDPPIATLLPSQATVSPALAITQRKESATAESLQKKLLQLNERIDAAKLTMTDKDENKTTALGTSKINYIDPRITAAWCNKHEVPIEKMFTRTLRDKFKWAMDAEADWEF